MQFWFSNISNLFCKIGNISVGYWDDLEVSLASNSSLSNSTITANNMYSVHEKRRIPSYYQFTSIPDGLQGVYHYKKGVIEGLCIFNLTKASDQSFWSESEDSENLYF